MMKINRPNSQVIAISCHFALNTNLSYEAKGLLVTLLATTNYKNIEVAQCSPYISDLMKELEREGYVQYEGSSLENILISDTPIKSTLDLPGVN